MLRLIAEPTAMPTPNERSPIATAELSADSGLHLRGRRGCWLCNHYGCRSRRVVNGDGIVLRNIDDLWIGRLDLHVRLAVIGLFGVHLHLRTGFEVARLLRLSPLALDCVHHALLVCLKGVPELARPIELQAHVVYNLGKAHQVLHAGAEASLLGGIGKCIPFEILVLQQPVTAVEDLLGIGRRGKNLRQ